MKDRERPVQRAMRAAQEGQLKGVTNPDTWTVWSRRGFEGLSNTDEGAEQLALDGGEDPILIKRGALDGPRR